MFKNDFIQLGVFDCYFEIKFHDFSKMVKIRIGNPKYIYKELLRRKTNFKIIWV
ncbi:hypothetical protein [Lentibacillus salinarum]|uniref:TarS C-terminal domain-containing protein n=1 Tax=Lentibacillus salinarum TaxID=446820 RepID=A0ABW3ZZR5_9BACI